MNKQIMKNEAMRRLKTLNVIKDVSDLFSNEDRLYYSERINKNMPAILYFLDNEQKYEQMKKEFEERTGHLVYHAILTNTTFGQILDFLFVSQYEEDWEYEFDENNRTYYIMSMANNLSDEHMSDMGSIMVRPVMGGLERIG